MQLMRLADTPLDRRDRVFQYSKPRLDRRVSARRNCIWRDRIWLAKKLLAFLLCRSRYRHLLIDFAQTRHRAIPLNQLARAHDRRRPFHKVPLVFELSVFRSRSHRRFHPVLRDQLGKVGKRTSSNTGPRRRQPTRHDDQDAALHRVGARRATPSHLRTRWLVNPSECSRSQRMAALTFHPIPTLTGPAGHAKSPAHRMGRRPECANHPRCAHAPHVG